MKLILSATVRNDSYTLRISKILQSIYKKENESIEILDMKNIPFDEIQDSPYHEDLSKKFKFYMDQIKSSKALIIVCPEYNGSFPGILKHFIDHWHYPASFAFKPIAFVGLGGRFGGFRSIEQLQAIFSYRNSFIFPQKIFLTNVRDRFEKDELKTQDPAFRLLQQQSRNFIKFVRALDREDFSIKTCLKDL